VSATRRTVLAGAALAALAALASGSPSGATVVAHRTLLVTSAPDGAPADGDSADPVLSDLGTVVALDSRATNLVASDPNGAQRDVFTIDLVTGERRLVSAPPDGGGADGPSSAPAISEDGQTVAFVSQATNLVAHDTNHVADVFVRTGDGAPMRVSVGPGGEEANGPSSQPDLSADGRYVVFTSAASNLVPGDTNGVPDVFLRDIDAGTTTRLSVSSAGAQGNARSSSPAIAGDASTVAFESAASNLVRRDRNNAADVFVRQIAAHRTLRVSVDSSEREQDRGIPAPFTASPDISDDGAIVVFDSDATNLTPGDTNEHTDLFRRDIPHGRTTLVSASSRNVQANNDSFSPALSPDGRVMAFESFATNLAPGDAPREDVFVRDLLHGSTTVATVPDAGGGRAPELVPQLLQRASLSGDGRAVAFVSTAPNLVPGDTNGHADVFVRRLDPPDGRQAGPVRTLHGRLVVALAADDPRATAFVCRIDRGAPFACGRSVTLPPGLRRGRHMLRARAGGPGMLSDASPVRVRFRVPG
jgi:Tol biopolymer transport system component